MIAATMNDPRWEMGCRGCKERSPKGGETYAAAITRFTIHNCTDHAYPNWSGRWVHELPVRIVHLIRGVEARAGAEAEGSYV